MRELLLFSTGELSGQISGVTLDGDGGSVTALPTISNIASAAAIDFHQGMSPSATLIRHQRQSPSATLIRHQRQSPSATLNRHQGQSPSATLNRHQGQSPSATLNAIKVLLSTILDGHQGQSPSTTMTSTKVSHRPPLCFLVAQSAPTACTYSYCKLVLFFHHYGTTYSSVRGVSFGRVHVRVCVC